MDQGVKKEYELSFLIKDQQGEAVLDGLLKQFGAEVSHKSQLVEMKLAYPVKKHKQANFGFIHFSLAPESVKNFSQALNLSPSVLRMLIISPPVGKLEKVRNQTSDYQSELRGNRVRIKKSEDNEAMPAKGGALSNKALEKTLEEILK